jgi:hypothetical protein
MAVGASAITVGGMKVVLKGSVVKTVIVKG